MAMAMLVPLVFLVFLRSSRRCAHITVAAVLVVVGHLCTPSLAPTVPSVSHPSCTLLRTVGSSCHTGVGRAGGGCVPHNMQACVCGSDDHLDDLD